MTKILLVQTFQGIGDYMATLPFQRELKRLFPESVLHVLVLSHSRFLPFYKINPYIDKVIVYDKNKKHKGILSQLKLLLKLRKEKYDIGFCFHPAKRYILTMWLSGIAQRIGYSYSNIWGRLLTETVAAEKVHATVNNLKFLERFGVSSEFKCIEKSLIDKKKLLKYLDYNDNNPYVVIAPGGTSEKKLWPINKFISLCDSIKEKYGLGLIFIGSKKEGNIFGYLREKFPKALFAMGKDFSVLHSAAFILGSKMLISNDQGNVHVASAMGVPVISIGPVNPDVWKPWSVGSSYLLEELDCTDDCPGADVCQDYICCKQIRVDRVFKEFERIMNNG